MDSVNEEPRLSVKRIILFRCVLFVLSGISAVFTPQQSQAWSPVGHQTIAYIADDRLTPQARQHIQAILPPGETLTTVATWADEIRDHRPGTRPWHYINIPVRTGVSITNIATYCTDHDLLSQIESHVETLKSPASTNQMEALKFLIHLVADSTMPLHCGDDGDRGGNDKMVRFYGRHGMLLWGKETNLHALWDHMIQTEAREDPRELASELEKHISQTDIATWATGSSEDWVLDTYTIARQTVYKTLPRGPTPKGRELALSRRYYSTMRPVADVQMAKAGIRLGELLNSIYGPGI